MIYFLDTSAILNGALKSYQEVYISPTIVKELEEIKTSYNKSEKTKYLARQAVRDILFNKNCYSFIAQPRKIDKIIKHNKFLSDINDHRILAEAILLHESEGKEVSFVTSDGALYLFARLFPQLNWIFYQPQLQTKEHEEYCGWRKFTPTESELVSLYSSPEINILNARINEFCEIYEEEELKDILFWNGEKYENLKYKNIKNPHTGEIIKPRNLEQKMAFHLLQNQNIKVKLLTSAWGGGKTMLALNYALEQIGKGNYDKLVFIRNNIIAANTNDIGYLPGTIADKMAIWSRCLADHVGGEMALEELIEEGIIETVPLSHIRGRSLRHSIVLVDECENMDDKLITLVMSRIEEDSELILCGDVAQIDKKAFEEHNGIRSLLEHLIDDPLFGTVKLIKSERGPVPRLCDKLIPPK